VLAEHAADRCMNFQLTNQTYQPKVTLDLKTMKFIVHDESIRRGVQLLGEASSPLWRLCGKACCVCCRATRLARKQSTWRGLGQLWRCGVGGAEGTRALPSLPGRPGVDHARTAPRRRIRGL